MAAVTDQEGVVIDFPWRPKVENELRGRMADFDAPLERAPGWNDCRHAKVSLHTVSRHLVCTKCDQVIDPVDWIENMAREWDTYLSRWRAAVSGIGRAEKELADLERRVRNAKARLRRHRAGGGSRDVRWLDLAAIGNRPLVERVRETFKQHGYTVTVAPDGAHLAPIGRVVEVTLGVLNGWDADEVWHDDEAINF